MLPTAMRRAISRICAVSLMTVATLATLTVLLDSPAAQANLDGQHSVAAPSTFTDVSIVDFSFAPKVITITAGSTVRWTNTGTFIHTSTSDTGVWNSGDINPGSVFTQTFNTPGNYPYHCMHHPFMMGTVVVIQTPPAEVSVTGPSVGTHDAAYAFTAAVTPITAARPITFFWQATNQSSFMHVGAGLSDTIVFSWTAGITGTQWITVTAANAGGSVSGTHLLIIDPIRTYLPLIFK